MNGRPWLLALIAITAIHVAVRIPLLDRDIWVDESVGLLFSTQPPGEAWRLAHDTYSPPLHLMMMSFLGEAARLAGWESTLPREGIEWHARNPDRSFYAVIPLWNGEVFTGGIAAPEMERWHLLPLGVLRLPSLVLSVATLWLAALFARRTTISFGISLAMAALLALAPAVAVWDTTVRYLSPVILPILGMAVLLWEIAAADALRRRWWLLVALAAVTALALLTHYVAAFFAPFVGLWLLLVCGRRRWRRTLGGGAAMLAGLAIFFLVWGSGFREQWGGSGLVNPQASGHPFQWINRFPFQPSLPHRLLVGMDGQTGVFTQFPEWWMFSYLGVLLVATGGYLGRLIKREGTRLDALLALWMFGPALLAVIVEALKPNTAGLAWRQFMGGAPAAALMFALGLAWLVQWRKWPRSRGVDVTV